MRTHGHLAELATDAAGLVSAELDAARESAFLFLLLFLSWSGADCLPYVSIVWREREEKRDAEREREEEREEEREGKGEGRGERGRRKRAREGRRREGKRRRGTEKRPTAIDLRASARVRGHCRRSQTVPALSSWATRKALSMREVKTAAARP